MSFLVGLILAGYVLEIAGAFVLAADEIGLERLLRWSDGMVRLRAELAGGSEAS